MTWRNQKSDPAPTDGSWIVIWCDWKESPIAVSYRREPFLPAAWRDSQQNRVTEFDHWLPLPRFEK